MAGERTVFGNGRGVVQPVEQFDPQETRAFEAGLRTVVEDVDERLAKHVLFEAEPGGCFR